MRLKAYELGLRKDCITFFAKSEGSKTNVIISAFSLNSYDLTSTDQLSTLPTYRHVLE